MLSRILLLGPWVGNSRGKPPLPPEGPGLAQFRDELSAEVSKVRHISVGSTNIWSVFRHFSSVPFVIFSSGLRPPACILQDFHGTGPESLFRSLSAPQMCKPGLLQPVSSPELGETLPGRDPVFPDVGVTTPDNKTENQVSTPGGALLALRSLLFVTHPDV
jgi:hypothetical protein